MGSRFAFGLSILICILGEQVAAGQSAKSIRVVKAQYPPEAQAAGHQGSVEISATILADGSISNAAVSKSSSSKLLDDAALTALAQWRFQPPVNAKGKIAPLAFSYEFSFYKLPLINADVALKTFKCSDFVSDVDWFEKTFPTQTRRDVRDYQVLALPFLGTASRARSADEMLTAGRAMRAKFVQLDKAYAACKTTPTATLLETLARS
jgi:TonB family protein